MRVIVTGASGILGTAVYDAFKGAGYEVLGLAHSRPKGDLVKLNLLDNTAVETAFGDFKPDCMVHYVLLSMQHWILKYIQGVIHCAAERRPDVAEKVWSMLYIVHRRSSTSFDIKDPAGAEKVRTFATDIARLTDWTTSES